MIYPTIKQYREAIACAGDNLNKLKHLNPVMDRGNKPYMITGGFAVVFKMRDDEGNLYALKCFTKEQNGREAAYKKIASELDYDDSGYMIQFKYYEKELFVDLGDDSVEMPVVFMDWVEGVTLDKYLNAPQTDLSQLVYRFSLLTRWLLNATFAHGDIKPDNIMVTPQGKLVLVDYDSMFVPSMTGEPARDLGTPGYSHPLRSTMPFDKHIDDFPLMLMLFSLKAVALRPELKATGDRILFSAEDLATPSQSVKFDEIKPILADAEAMKCYALFMFALSQGNLDGIDDKLTHLKKPEKKSNITFTGETSNILLGSTSIPDHLFDDIPNEVDYAYNEHFIILPPVKKIGNCVFGACVRSIISQSPHFIVENKALFSADKSILYCYFGEQTVYIVPDTVKTIMGCAFTPCRDKTYIYIGSNVEHMLSDPFVDTRNVLPIIQSSKNFVIQDGLLIDVKKRAVIAHIQNGDEKKSIKLPSTIKSIGEYAFFRANVSSITFLGNSLTIHENAFLGCFPKFYTNYCDEKALKKALPKYLQDNVELYLPF